MSITYGALSVEIAKQGDALIVVNLKAGSTTRTAEKRMQDHSASYATNVETTYKLRDEPRIIGGITDFGYWTPIYDGGYRNLNAQNLFYQRKVRNFHESEQRLINTNRKICRQFAGGKVKVILHHGDPDDNRTNPCPYEKRINPSYYRTIKKIIKEKIKEAVRDIGETDEEVIKLKNQIRMSQDRLGQLSLSFAEQQKELLAIKI